MEVEARDRERERAARGREGPLGQRVRACDQSQRGREVPRGCEGALNFYSVREWVEYNFKAARQLRERE